jgi:RHS repeat-associated protein
VEGSGEGDHQNRLAGLYETSTTGTILNTDSAGPAGDLAHYAGPPTMGSTVSFLSYSGHGDLAAEANTSGTRTASYTYDPFGQLRSGSAPANATSERWTARHDKKLDSADSLIEMGARPYDVAVSRFLSLDPSEDSEGSCYAYAGQDPVNMYDLGGESCGPSLLGDLGIVDWIFTDACDFHDRCYGGKGEYYNWSRSDCDNEFYRLMKSACEDHYGGTFLGAHYDPRWYACRGYARTLYGIVSGAGRFYPLFYKARYSECRKRGGSKSYCFARAAAQGNS